METEMRKGVGERRLPESRVVCSHCEQRLTLEGRLMIGEVFDCPRCGAPLEIAGLDPVAIEPFARIEEG